MGTPPAAARFGQVDRNRPIWLVTNASSGSNDDAARDALLDCCVSSGLTVARQSKLPDQELPTPSQLQQAGIEEVVVYAGDGTTNALRTALAGWDGAVLVLPGGTKNLLFHRLHGEQPLEDVVAQFVAGRAQRVRPGVIHHMQGIAYAELLGGPGATWGRVREAMRDAAITEIAGATAEAMNETLAGQMVACAEPRLGRPEGYPLVALRARDEGLEVVAYYAEDAGEFLEQAWAMVTRNFREGPHEVLGLAREVHLASEGGGPIELLIDGEQVQTASPAQFRLAPCEVDLVATAYDDT